MAEKKDEKKTAAEGTAKGFKVAPVDAYPERPLEDALAKDHDVVRPQVDQIADYHEKHPTLSNKDLPSNADLTRLHSKAEDAAQDALPGI